MHSDLSITTVSCTNPCLHFEKSGMPLRQYESIKIHFLLAVSLTMCTLIVRATCKGKKRNFSLLVYHKV